MNRYIERIQVNGVYHLAGFTISIASDEYPHLMLMGKNGSGRCARCYTARFPTAAGGIG